MFDRPALAQTIADHGPLVRVVICGHQGSSPREAGAAMLVWADGQSGTIGGGALEFQAAARARALLTAGGVAVERLALGPALGQCCGGAVTLVMAVCDAGRVAAMEGPPLVATGAGEMPLSVRRLLATARGQGVAGLERLVDGWFVEPVLVPDRQVWVWGAGHVGRALVAVLAPLPGMAVTWVDVAPERFPDLVPEGVTPVWAARPEDLVAHAPQAAEHLVLTYSHALDLELCHRLLVRGFRSCGLIGSATKWARFRSRLAALGHDPASAGRIRCPIGDPGLGKHPQAIAVGVAAQILRDRTEMARERTA